MRSTTLRFSAMGLFAVLLFGCNTSQSTPSLTPNLNLNAGNAGNTVVTDPVNKAIVPNPNAGTTVVATSPACSSVVSIITVTAGTCPASSTAGGAAITSSSGILVNAASNIATITADQLGSNLSSYAYIDITQSFHLQDLKNLGVKLVRWPGGSASDTYHWQNDTSCSNNAGPKDTFDNFINDIVKPGNFDFAITLDYGTNVACNGGGDPAEAAAWVAQASALGYTGKHWTVGNEVYGSWETDKHTPAHDPGMYVTQLNTGFYPQIKAADPTAQVGAVISGGFAQSWDTQIITQGKYDFLEYHWYPENFVDNDAVLLQSPSAFTSEVQKLRNELVAAGKPANTPIFYGEFNSQSTYTDLSKQSVSIVNGLFAGMMLGEILNDGIPLATWWSTDTEGQSPSNDTAVYGWQPFGTYSMADSNGSGTIYPPGRAYQLAAQFAVPGNHMLTTTVNASFPNVRAYAATQGSGYALFLFNLSESNAATLAVSVSSASRTGFTGSTLTYGKAQYDNSLNNVWTAPVTQSLGTVGDVLQITLPVWSMTVLTLQ